MFHFLVQGFLNCLLMLEGRISSIVLFFFFLFFFQNKLFNINTDYPIAHFKESNSNFQNFGDLIFFWIYGQSPRSPQHGFFSLSSVFFQRTL